MKDLAKVVALTGIFAIPFIVLIISNSMFFPFITGKNFTFRIIVEVIFAAWIILALYEPQYRLKFSWIVVTFTGFLGVMLIANSLGQNPIASFWSNFERMEGYVTLVHTYVYMLVAGSVLRTAKLWDRFFNATIAVAVILSLYAFAQLSGNITINQGGWRLDGTLGNSAYMAIYMLFHVFITIFMLAHTKSIGGRYTYGALVLLFTYLLLQTATRGTTIGLIGGLFVAVTYIALFSKEYPKVRTFAVGGIVAIIGVVSLFVTFKESAFVQNNPYLQRVASISFAELQNRFNIWNMAFEGVKERPILGWGQSNYNYVFNKYYRPELHGGEAWFDRVHNIVMDWLIAGGVLGLVAYFSIYGSALYYLFFRPLFNKDDEAFTVIERGVLLGLLAGYLVHNMVVFDNIVSYIFYGTILAYIHARVGTPIPRLERAKFDPRLIEQIVTPVVAIVMATTVYYVNVPNIQAAGDIIDAFKVQDPKNIDGMLAAFDRALARDSFASQEIREQLTQRVLSVINREGVSPDMRQKAITRVEEELLKQAESNPNDARVRMFLSSFYRSTGNLDKAIEHLTIARELSPNKQLVIFEQGFAYLQKQEFEKAVGYFKEAYDLGPQFMDSRINYAIGAIYAGKLGLVDELIQTDEQKRAFAMNENAVQAVYNAKMYPRLVDMFKLQVEQKPDDIQARTNLAFILNESGNAPEAIAVLTKAGEDIPSFKEQANGFIAGIVAKVNEKGKVAPQTVEINGKTLPVHTSAE